MSMKVIFIPDYRRENSYQRNLADSLLNQDVQIYFNSAGTGGGVSALIESVIKNWKIDVLHIHWTHPFITEKNRVVAVFKSTFFISELILLKLFGVKIVWTMHNIMGHDSKLKYLESLFNRVLSKISDKIIVHCPSSKNEIEKIYKSVSIDVINHGNYISQYQNSITNNEARKRLRIYDDEIVFLYFGQVRPYKGILELIDVFKKLKSEKIKLVIAGKPDNNIKDEILRACVGDDQISTILEFIPDNDVQIYMNAADIVVLPYKNILTSGVAMLAMSFGKPIIAPSIGCIPDILDKKGSFLFSTTDENSLFDQMQSVLKVERETLKNMGIHNYELVKMFDWNGIGKRTYEIYKEIV